MHEFVKAMISGAVGAYLGPYIVDAARDADDAKKVGLKNDMALIGTTAIATAAIYTVIDMMMD